jgi:hypothetical protein
MREDGDDRRYPNFSADFDERGEKIRLIGLDSSFSGFRVETHPDGTDGSTQTLRIDASNSWRRATDETPTVQPQNRQLSSNLQRRFDGAGVSQRLAKHPRIQTPLPADDWKTRYKQCLFIGSLGLPISRSRQSLRNFLPP